MTQIAAIEVYIPSGYTQGMAKIMISIPDDLLAELDFEAKSRKISRSALIAKAVRRQLDKPERERIDQLLAEAREAWVDVDGVSVQEFIRHDRDTRR